MKIFYRILATNPADGTMLVRYWSDVTGEDSLATEMELYDVVGDPVGAPDTVTGSDWRVKRDSAGKPTRTRLDFNLQIPDPVPIEQALQDYVLLWAPIEFLRRVAQPLDISTITAAVGVDVESTDDRAETLKTATRGIPIVKL